MFENLMSTYKKMKLDIYQPPKSIQNELINDLTVEPENVKVL
jgi:hypothetical protein